MDTPESTGYVKTIGNVELLANMFADAPRGDEEEEERLENIGLDNILEVHEDAQGEEVSLV